MPDWEEYKRFEESANKAWRQTLLEFFKPEIILVQCYDDNLQIQSEHWDKMLIFRGSEPGKRIELKTRKEKYYNKFKNDGTLVFETMGNVERNILGSSIFNSNAEYWGYGFYIPEENPNSIMEPQIFFREELADYLKYNLRKYRPWTTETNGLYHTQGIFVQLSEVEKFKVRPMLKFNW